MKEMENKEEAKKPTSPWGYLMMAALLLAVLSLGIYIGLTKGDTMNTLASHISSQGWAIITIVLLFVMFICSRMFKKRNKTIYK